MLGEALVALVEILGAIADWPGPRGPDAGAQREGIATPAGAEERATAPQKGRGGHIRAVPQPPDAPVDPRPNRGIIER